MQIDDLRERVEELAHDHALLSQLELKECNRIAHAIKAMNNKKEEDLLRSTRGLPLTQIYMSGGWSARVSATIVENEGGVQVTRKGHYRHEFVLERGILCGRTLDEDDHFVMQMGPPMGVAARENDLELVDCGLRVPRDVEGSRPRGPRFEYIFDGRHVGEAFR